MEYFIYTLIGLIIGLWIGIGITYLVFLRSRSSDGDKDKKIKDLIYTKNQLIRANRELEEEIELRDKK